MGFKMATGRTTVEAAGSGVSGMAQRVPYKTAAMALFRDVDRGASGRSLLAGERVMGILGRGHGSDRWAAGRGCHEWTSHAIYTMTSMYSSYCLDLLAATVTTLLFPGNPASPLAPNCL